MRIKVLERKIIPKYFPILFIILFHVYTCVILKTVLQYMKPLSNMYSFPLTLRHMNVSALCLNERPGHFCVKAATAILISVTLVTFRPY